MSKRKISNSKETEKFETDDPKKTWIQGLSVFEATKLFLKGKTYPHLARKILSCLDAISVLDLQEVMPCAFFYECRDMLIKKRDFYNATSLYRGDTVGTELAATLEFVELPAKEHHHTMVDRVRTILLHFMKIQK